jgi:hypothetical protein
MNKTGKLVLFAILTVLTVLFSCKEPFLSGPQLSSGGAKERGIVAPEGIKASQGEKRNITLSWNEEPNAVLYYIYQTENPLNSFVRCGETTSTQFNFNVPPGSVFYYRVSSVSYDGIESSKSVYVRGTSLAQPVISDITDITESAAAVTWYMENVFEDSYKNDLLYTVYCFNGASEIAQIALDGSVITENRAVFTSLSPNTRYEYQVEAYLRGDQSASEKSDKMDAATARRFRPGAPINLIASRGTAADRITLSFELPDMVDIALGENLYDPKPVYFKIFKRFYSESGNNEYLPKCTYFGINASKGETFTGGYIPGATVTWSDTAVSRGVKYEYMVQSYVDDTPKTITSDSSKSNSHGWALSEGNLSFGKVEYTMGNGLYASAKLPLDFEFDPKDELYSYVLVEKIEPLDDTDPLNPSGNISIEKTFDTYNSVRAHVPAMDLTKKTSKDNPGRGLYSYSVEIKRDGVLLDTISTIGKKEVSENTDPIVVDNFRVQDGYTNKFVLKWDYYSNRKYTLFIVDSKGNEIKEIGSVNETPAEDAELNDSYSFTYEAPDIVPGVTRYFAIRPTRIIGGTSKPGQKVYASTASRTLGVPELTLDGGVSYSSFTAAWSDTQKADTYRIKYRYTEDSAYKTAATVKKENLSLDAAGRLKYTFKPEGNEIDITKAGKEIQIQVDALNEGLRATIGGTEISTSSKEDVRTRLLGPSELGLSAGRASSAQEIDVSWNKITGADGYYVFRRKFNMANSSEEGTDAVVYYVPASETGTINVTGKDMALDSNNSKIDTNTVKATASFANSRYTLKDIFMSDGEYEGSAYSRHTIDYRNQQNDMIQGYPYRYWVVPVKSDTALNSIDFVYNKDSSNKNADIAYYTIQENGAVKYSGAANIEKNAGTGFTIGLGQNVTATKGTYASSGNINDGVKITWSPPPLLSAVSPQYTVYRRASGSSTWETITSVSSLQHIDTTLTRGITYEYAIGITNGTLGTSDPRSSRRFIELCKNFRDEKNRPFMLGYTLDMVKMNSVSRNERKVGDAFAEEVNWKSAKIINTYSDDYNWGIDGYEVYVMNRNIDGEWHKITEVSYANIPNQTDQSIMVTTGMGSVTINTTAGATTFDLLRVMRDYKHFYKIRSYVLNDNNVRIYCPDPNWTYTYQFGTSEADHIAKSNNMQNDYVKWGARQITTDEFIKIVSVYAGRGICESWKDGAILPTTTSKTYDAGKTWGGSGSVTQNYVYQGATDSHRTFKYNNFKVDLQTRTGQWMTFITIDGNIWARSYAINTWPFRYGEDGWVTIKGPWDTPDLYTGQIKFGVNGLGDNSGFSWNGNGTLSGGTSTGSSGGTKAKIGVKYPGTVANPGAAAEQQILYRGQDTALNFKGEGDTRYQLEHFK